MENVLPGLYASAPESPSFAPEFDIRAFLLERPQGNFLIYSASTVATDARAIENLGGISRHYLNHWHEAGFGCDRIVDAFGAPLVCHEDERQQVSESCTVSETFSERHMFADDFEVIPIPGHTSGATAFLWDSGQHRCLFPGDTIVLQRGEWIDGLLESSDRNAFIESLNRLREIDFDVLVPVAATSGQSPHSMTDKDDARGRIDAILERIGNGAER